MPWSERWEMGDPAKILERRQEQERRRIERSRDWRQEQAKKALQAIFGGEMTVELSEQLEEYLMIWYRYELSYRPSLGAPRVSVSCRGHQSTEVHNDADESEIRYRKGVAETVGACLDELPWQQRSAVGLHCAARHSGASVIRNPRMTIEEHHKQYQAAKLAIFGMPRMRELMR